MFELFKNVSRRGFYLLVGSPHVHLDSGREFPGQLVELPLPFVAEASPEGMVSCRRSFFIDPLAERIQRFGMTPGMPLVQVPVALVAGGIP